MTEESNLTLKPLLPLSGTEKGSLERCEQVIARGVTTFFEVGAALTEIRDSRLYRCEYPTFESYCRERWDMGRAHAYRLIESAGVVENLSPIGDGILPANEAQARELIPYEPEIQKAVWQIVTNTLPKGAKLTAGHVRSVAIQVSEIVNAGGMDNGDGIITPLGQLLKAHITEEVSERFRRQTVHIQDKLGDSDEWLTAQSEYLDVAREVLGRIDLDPASCAAANKIIKAKKFFTKQDNGLTKEWFGRVWLSPPFSLVEKFAFYAIEQYVKRNTKAAIILTNNCTDAEWFQVLMRRFLVCFPSSRAPFWRVDREGTGGARQGQAFFYLGEQGSLFVEKFSQFGTTVKAFPENITG
ncbi:MAG: phage N-6-adenine-methyltransferase [Acidobacteriota bacterium]|nr:phage N-6-adenine-methyltransferase [Acidobacteriota bacterium]